MPSAPYLIVAQVLIIAVSAALMDDNKHEQKVPSKQPAERDDASGASPVDPALLAKAKAMPAEVIDRFGVLENDAILADALPPRRMGFDAGAEEGSLLREFHGAAVVVQQDTAPAPEFPPLDAAAGYHITSESATNFNLRTNSVVFTGSVVLKCPDFTLHAARLVVQMDKNQALEKLVANGAVDVHLVGVPREEAYRGRAEEAVYDPQAGTITLSGWPKITGFEKEHNATTAATRMVLHTRRPKLETMGRASTRLVYDGGGGLPGLSIGQGTPSAPQPGKP